MLSRDIQDKCKIQIKFLEMKTKISELKKYTGWDYGWLNIAEENTSELKESNRSNP